MMVIMTMIHPRDDDVVDEVACSRPQLVGYDDGACGACDGAYD